MRAAPPTPTGAAAGRRSKEPARPVGRSPEDGESAGTGRRGGPAGPRSSFEPPVRQDGCLERVEQGPALREFEDASFSRAPSEKRVVRQVSWLPDPQPSGSFPNAQPVCRSLAFSGLPPEASPVTVAGAARDFHPLPLAEQTQRTEEREP